MGNCSSAARDAYGNVLEVGCWAECTSHNVASIVASIAQVPGQVTAINTYQVTLDFPMWGTYNYSQNDTVYYGIRRIVVDAEGRKLKLDQLVETSDGREGLVIAVDDFTATFSFGKTSRLNPVKNYTYCQADISNHGIKVMGAAGHSRNARRCQAPSCM